jgi:phosphatidylglycerol:prolipoprotein diacylglycerol transferase
MSIPFEPEIAGRIINIHLILEYLAFFVAFRYYLNLRRNAVDAISTSNRLSIILGAIVGALLGSRIMGFLENPVVDLSEVSFIQLYETKTIMGGLFGGLLGVESVKRIIGESQSSGDLFTLPIVVGIFIGRIGCFLAGTNEFTYGITTSFITGMNLGDGLNRHPLALYEMVFLALLFILLRNQYRKNQNQNGLLFRLLMISYFGFRFIIEFIKPNTFTLLGFSSIQWLCILCFVYYRRTILNFFRADQKVHLL